MVALEIPPPSQIGEHCYIAASGSNATGGQIGPEQAEELVATSRSRSRLDVAKIAIEAAYVAGRDQNRSEAEHWLTVAGDTLTAISQYHAGQACPNVLVATTAAVLTGQLPGYQRLILDRQLPNEEVGHAGYMTLLENAQSLRQVLGEGRGLTLLARTKVAGYLAELAVLGLGQRYALQSSIGCDTWFPLPAFYSADYEQNEAGDAVNKAWDITFFSAVDTAPPESIYRLQVKSSNNQTKRSYDMPGISRVCVTPHLRVQRKERGIVRKIIGGCYLEQVETKDMTRITEELNERSERLLDRLDSTSYQLPVKEAS